MEEHDQMSKKYDPMGHIKWKEDQIGSDPLGIVAFVFMFGAAITILILLIRAMV